MVNKYGKVATSSLTSQVLAHIQCYFCLSPLLPKTVHDYFWNISRAHNKSKSVSIQEELNHTLMQKHLLPVAAEDPERTA